MTQIDPWARVAIEVPSGDHETEKNPYPVRIIVHDGTEATHVRAVRCHEIDTLLDTAAARGECKELAVRRPSRLATRSSPGRRPGTQPEPSVAATKTRSSHGGSATVHRE